MKLIDMQLSPDEAKKEYGAPTSSMLSDDDDLPKYPWGLSLCLDDETIGKLNLGELPDVGTTFTLMAVVEVTSNSQRQNQDGKSVSMDLQITSMALSPAPDKTAEQGLYSASDMNP